MNIQGTTRDGKQIIVRGEFEKELRKTLSFESKNDLILRFIVFVFAFAIAATLTVSFTNMAINAPSGFVSVAATIAVPLIALTILGFYAHQFLVPPIRTLLCLNRCEIILATDRVCARDSKRTRKGAGEIGILHFTEGGSKTVSIDDYRKSSLGDEYYVFAFNTKKRHVLAAFSTEKYVIKQ